MPHPVPGRDEMIAGLVATPSVSCVEPALDMSNRPVAEKLAGWLLALGFRVEIHDIQGWPGKVNMIATLGEGDGGLVLAGHLDTVPFDADGWRGDPFTVRREGERLVGLGTADMKSFLAVAASAAAKFANANFRQPLILLGTADEESSMCGDRALVDTGQPRARHAVIGEPTGMRPVRTHKGILMEAIHVHGRAGHSSNPAFGLNALEGMHRVMQALMQWREELKRDWQDEVFDVAQPTMNFGHLHGGDNPNRICADAELHIDLRLLPGMPLEEFRKRLRERASTALQGTEFHVSSRSLFDGIGGLATPADAAIVKSAENLTGTPAGSAVFATEGPFLQALDMDVIIMGPGHIDVAHQPEEYVEFSQLDRCEKILERLIHEYCISPQA